MKFKLSVSDENYDEVKSFLSDHGIELSEDADYTISQNLNRPDFLPVSNEKKEHLKLSPDEVIYIEAFGKNIEIHTMNETYYSRERMYRLEEMLDPAEFVRISKSVIISKSHVKKIRPTLSMKYVLTLSNKDTVDVTRSYYNEFRRSFNI
ncbi:MAG: LytTR family transcriptional regulator [Lachnospiraceae bacterium]|nr:LytTR family transcriptional regulator [Lachnospiraceae bacterium]